MGISQIRFIGSVLWEVPQCFLGNPCFWESPQQTRGEQCQCYKWMGGTRRPDGTGSMVAMGVKVMWEYNSGIFGCDSNPWSQSVPVLLHY